MAGNLREMSPDEPTPIARPAMPSPQRTTVIGHLIALLAVGIAALVALLLDRSVDSANEAMVFLLCVLMTGAFVGLWPAVTAAAASAVAYSFIFMEPRLAPSISHAADVFTFAVFFAVALITGWLTGRVRDQSRAASRRAATIASVLSVTREFSASATPAEAARALAEQLAATTGAPAAVLTPEADGLRLLGRSPGDLVLGPDDLTAAQSAWAQGDDVPGRPGAAWTFRALQGLKSRAGVVAVDLSAVTTPEGRRFVTALLDQGAVALERAKFAAMAADTEALKRADHLRRALLNSVSHDLRTPLSTVLGSATTLIDYGETLGPEVRADLLASIREEAERLKRYVGDLLDMSRLEGGALVTRREYVDVRDVVRAAGERIRRGLERRDLAFHLPAAMTPVMADPSLLEQGLVNILENAISYSPDGTAIGVAAYEDRCNVVIRIEDEGRGIPTEDLERVFETFRRSDEGADRAKGAGLGLAISKGFVEAMGGRVSAVSPIRDGRGTRVLISLPKEAIAAAAAASAHA